MKTFHASELVGDVRATLGEGPVWDSQAGVLVWVDIVGRALHVSGSGAPSESHAMDGEPGCAVLDGNGDFLVAVEHRLLHLDRVTGQFRVMSELPADRRLRFNDGKVDPAGRLWVGTMDREELEPLGALYCYDGAEFKCRERGITVSNGLGWSPSGDAMYYIDSSRREVWRYDFDLPSGELSNRSVLNAFGEQDGFPDGMAVDAVGNLWVAFWDGGKVLCLSARSGEVLAAIEVPAKRVTSCAFGGTDLERLFITTARVGLTEAEQPLAGRLFVVDVGVDGMACTFFKPL